MDLNLSELLEQSHYIFERMLELILRYVLILYINHVIFVNTS